MPSAVGPMGDASVVIPEPLLRELAAAAASVRDRAYDVLTAMSGRPAAGFSYSDGTLDEVWASLRSDGSTFVFAIDFVETPRGLKLARTSGGWSLLPDALLADGYFREAFAGYLARRFGEPGCITARSQDFTERPERMRILARTGAQVGFEVQLCALETDWDDAAEMSGALICAPYLAAFLGEYSLPPASLPLAFPLWTALLDEPALLVHLPKYFPDDPVLAPASLAAHGGGRTVGQQTGISITNVAAIRQDLGVDTARPLPMFRAVVSENRVLGIFLLRDANLRDARSGHLQAVRPSWQTT